MTETYKLIHPAKYFSNFISRKLRPDSRKFEEFRDVVLKVNSISTADASAKMKLGNTNVICGIKLELAKPKAEEPNVGFLITNVELPALCSGKLKPGPPSDIAQVTSNLVSDILKNSQIIDYKELCIVPDKLAWVIYCDIICLDNDGSVVDACLTTLVASLKSLTLPTVLFDPETEEIVVDVDCQKPLPIHGLPVISSFAVYNGEIILADPTAYEEDMCGGQEANLVICWNNNLLCGIHKFGSHNISKEVQEKAMKVAKNRSTVIENVITAAIKNKQKK